MLKPNGPLLKTYGHPWMSRRSYQIFDSSSGTSAVVDPVLDVDPYLQDAWVRGCRIQHVFMTRESLGYEAGHLQLRDRAQARIYMGAWCRPSFGFSPLKDGDVLEFGDVRFKILETPGRALESISILYYDLSIDSRSPRAVLTGDTLLIGDVGTPDVDPSRGLSCRELAGMLYGSLRSKLLTLPGDTRVYPGQASGDLWSTIDRERRSNHGLSPMSRSEFARRVCSGRAAPREASARRTVRPRPLSLKDFLRRREAGMILLDLRGEADFAGAHLEGSLHIGWAGPFRKWAGELLDPGHPAGIIAEPKREVEAAGELAGLGVPVSGFLRYGMEALEERPDLLRKTSRTTASALAAEVSSGRGPRILDVRTSRERQRGGIDGSLHIPLNRLRERVSEIPRGERIVICCSVGYRSSIAASLLEREGIEGISVLIGGLAAWETERKQ